MVSPQVVFTLLITMQSKVYLIILFVNISHSFRDIYRTKQGIFKFIVVKALLCYLDMHAGVTFG